MSSNPKNTRMCIACRERSDKSEMLRVVRNPQGEVAVDESGCADGRGVWIHDCDECKSKVIRRKMLNAAFKSAVSEDVYEQIKSR